MSCCSRRCKRRRVRVRAHGEEDDDERHLDVVEAPINIETIVIVTNVQNRIDGRLFCYVTLISVFLDLFKVSFRLIKNDTMLFDQKAHHDTGGGGCSGTSGSLPSNFESKVIAPRNPTLNRGPKIEPKVSRPRSDKNNLRRFIVLVHTLDIHERNVPRYSTETIEYQRNVSSKNYRSL